MLDVETAAGPGWDDEDSWADLARRAVRAGLSVSPFANLIDKKVSVEVAVKLSDNAEVQSLNANYRGKDKPTNVLSFPMVQPDLLQSLENSDDGEALLGDIILARETCAAEAAEKDISLHQHATHLMVHGTLHLLGYDHENEADAERMEDLEVKALASLGLPNPYS
ncbi:rRNA maturation RNase YbeY [Novosphingopyxis baekryungensis]|uniref:rRNA maturation RNase YbeY n=1 Tax=Novosphingopyxis baekryungensis TaxID=279369 RepID=UPI0003B3E24A|nr:rRNA maturation RNase YbeY [Novosphingopyxis baekryungensis]